MYSKIPNTYDYLVSGDNPTYTEEDIWHRYCFWSGIIQDTIKRAGLENKVTINERKLIYMVLNYFADIVRLKEFHPVDRTNRVKTFAYSFFWLLRTAPVQLLQEVDDNYLFINEKIVVDTFYTQFIYDFETANRLDNEVILKYLREVLYYFKYRKYDQQSIESLILSFVIGSGSNPFNDISSISS